MKFVQLIPESLFLAIWILDRFLSKQEVERRNLQLVWFFGHRCGNALSFKASNAVSD